LASSGECRACIADWTEELKPREGDDPESLLLRDYEQAWNHLRHVETVRIQYTSFFFTIVLGSIALSVPLFVQRTGSVPSLVVASCFTGGLATFSSSIYLSMRRIGVQLRHYRRSEPPRSRRPFSVITGHRERIRFDEELIYHYPSLAAASARKARAEGPSPPGGSHGRGGRRQGRSDHGLLALGRKSRPIWPTGPALSAAAARRLMPRSDAA
jgi:hypothetical protein